MGDDIHVESDIRVVTHIYTYKINAGVVRYLSYKIYVEYRILVLKYTKENISVP